MRGFLQSVFPDKDKGPEDAQQTDRPEQVTDGTEIQALMRADGHILEEKLALSQSHPPSERLQAPERGISPSTEFSPMDIKGE